MGGLFDKQPDTVQTTQKQELDPDMKRRLLGMMDRGEALYNKNPTGMNDMMRAGMEMQRQQLTDPQYAQGYQQQRGLAQSLMGGGLAGNPFMRGGGSSGMGGLFGGLGGGGLMQLLGGQRQMPGSFGADRAGGGLEQSMQRPPMQPLPEAAMRPIEQEPTARQQQAVAPTQMQQPQRTQEEDDFLREMRRRYQQEYESSVRY
ncbi:MAG: hypothetical protein ACRCWJ_16395 [Casimicrobium sp.]